MKIVILDGFTTNPGDLDWSQLAKLGELTAYDRTAPSEIIERAKDAEILLDNKVVLTKEIIDNLPNLKYIGILATGTNIVDIQAAKARGILVSNVPSYSTNSVAQNTIALLLALTNRVEHYAREFHAGEWSRCADFCYYNDTPLIELAGKKIGIIGYGHIGQMVGRIAMALGMEVYAGTSKSQDQLREAVKMDIDDIFKTCDVVSLHCPLTENTFHLANAERINSMKKNAILLNTARGPLVDEDALAKALKEGRIAGAGLDVLGQEPPKADNPLITAPNCMVTPHISWATFEARQRLVNTAVKNVETYLSGQPQNLV